MSDDLEKSPLWKKCKDLIPPIEEVIRQIPHSEAWTLANPLHQTAISLTSDVAMAVGRDNRDSLYDYRYARGHLYTIKSLILIVRELGYLENADSALVEIEIIRRMLDEKVDELSEEDEAAHES